MSLTFGSLFAGIGGFDLGLERAGMKCLWQVEIDDYANKVLEKHWPDVKRIRDIRESGKQNLEPVDLICGGFPCQPHSLAGKRKGSADPRDLWGEFARIIGELRPRFVVAENVPGLLSSESGRFFGRVLRGLATCGYDAEWQCIPASAFGAPHRRDRVWILAYPMRSQQRRHQRKGKTEKNALENPRCPHGEERTKEQRTFRGMQTNRKTHHYIERSGDVADTNGERFQFTRAIGSTKKKPLLRSLSGKWDWWKIEPDVGRVVDGLPNRSHRLRCLGNAVVPQVVEFLGRIIMKAEFSVKMQIKENSF